MKLQPKLGHDQAISLVGLNGTDSLSKYSEFVEQVQTGKVFSVQLNSVHLVRKILSNRMEHQVRVIDCFIIEGGSIELNLQAARGENLQLLQISSYRCPGPMAEIKLKVSGLDYGEILQLGIYIAGFKSDPLVNSLKEFGYSVMNEVGGGEAPFFAEIVARRNCLE